VKQDHSEKLPSVAPDSRQAEGPCRTILDNAPDAIILWEFCGADQPFRIVEANRSACERFGYSRQEMLGLTGRELNAPDSYINVGDISRLLSERGYAVYEMAHLSKDGRRIPAEVAGQQFQLDGKTMVVSVIRDITERKRLELRNQGLTSFPLANPNPVLRVNPDGKITFANPASAPLLVQWQPGTDGRLPAPWPDIIGEVFRSGCRKITEITCRNQVFSLTLNPDVENSYINLYALDITDRRRMEDEIKEKRDFLERLNDSLPEAVFNLDHPGHRIVYVNQQVSKIYGYTPRECLGQTMEFLFNSPEDFQDYDGELTRSIERDEHYRAFELFQQNKNGERFPCEIIQNFTHRPDGSLGIIIIVRDISERRQAQAEIEIYQHHLEDMVLERTRELELEIKSRLKAEAELRELFERERSLSTELKKQIEERLLFTRGLVHELKTPLTPLITASDYLEQHLNDDTARSFAHNIHTGALNMEKRVNELLDLAQGEVGTLKIHPSRFNLNELLVSIVGYMRPDAERRNQRLELNLPEQQLFLNADPDRLRQVISNLLANSFKFTRRGGWVKLTVEEEEESVVISVTDNGSGIDESEQPFVFQAYHRGQTSEKSRLSGLGLGLTLSRMFVELHGGRIWFESSKGEGSTFYVKVPINKQGEKDENTYR
jgi:PAS domain S-box-containing protein